MPIPVGRLFPKLDDPKTQQEIDRIYHILQNLKIRGDQIDATSVAQVVGPAFRDGQITPLNRVLVIDQQSERLKLKNIGGPDDYTLYCVKQGVANTDFAAAFFSADNPTTTTTPTVRIEQQGNGACLYLRKAGTGGGVTLKIEASGADNQIEDSNNPAARLTAGGVWTNASSRELKDGFRLPDVAGIVERLKALPIWHYHYKRNPEEHHIGPVSEDFHRLFDTGNDKSLSAADLASVVAIAVQWILQKLEMLEARISKLTP